MSRKTGVKRKSSLQHKLTRTVMGGVLAAFIFSFLTIIVLTNHNEVKQERARFQNQINTVASRIRMLQDSVANMAEQIIFDDRITDFSAKKRDSVGLYLSDKRKSQNILRNYMHIIGGIVEILYYQNDGDSVSTREVRDDFVPEKNPWYTQYLDTGRICGYTGIHSSEPTSNNYAIDVISYIQQNILHAEDTKLTGSVILNIEYDQIKDILKMESSLISGYILYGAGGDVLYSEGTVQTGYEQLVSMVQGENQEKSLQQSRIVVSADLRDNWILALELSEGQLWQQSLMSTAYLVLVFVIVFMVTFLILRHSLHRIVTPILEVTDTAQKVGSGDFDVSLSIHTGDEIELLADVFNKMVVDIRTLMNESVEHEKVYRRMQIENLMLQINPHFIYNTMNSIVYIARMGGNPQIADFANAFISLLQSTLKVTDTIYNSVREELFAVENYIYLQRYRYADKFTYDIACEEELKDCQILNVTLQPIVENAIFHGIAPKEGNAHIHIGITREEDQLVIVVQDDGIGMTAENAESVLHHEQKKKHSGVRKIGVANVYQRIKEIYGDPYGMTIESAVNEGTVVTITVPYVRMETRPDELTASDE